MVTVVDMNTSEVRDVREPECVRALGNPEPGVLDRDQSDQLESRADSRRYPIHTYIVHHTYTVPRDSDNNTVSSNTTFSGQVGQRGDHTVPVIRFEIVYDINCITFITQSTFAL
jgi:hypothetical protein